MSPAKDHSLLVLKPNLQISFYYRLQELRELYLHSAMKQTIEKMEMKRLDQELSRFVTVGPLTNRSSI